MNSSDAIKNMFKCTHTPASKFALQGLLLTSKQGLPGTRIITELDDIKEAISFFTRLLDCPKPIFLPTVSRQVRFLINGLAKNIDQDLLYDLEILLDWYCKKLIDIHRLNPLPKSYGTITTHSLYWFHVKGGLSREYPDNEPLDPTYRQFGCEIHMLLRKIESYYPETTDDEGRHVLYHYELALRTLMAAGNQIPAGINFKELMRNTELVEGIIRAGFFGFQEEEEGVVLGADDADVDESYIKNRMSRLNTLVSGQPRIKKISSLSVIKATKGAARANRLASAPKPVTGVRVEAHSNRTGTIDQAPSENQEVTLVGVTRSHRLPLYVQSQMTEALRYHRIKPWYAAGGLLKYHLGHLYNVIFSAPFAHLSHLDRSWRLLVLLIIYTGIKPWELIKMEIGRWTEHGGNKPNTQLLFDQQEGTLIYLPPKRLIVSDKPMVVGLPAGLSDALIQHASMLYGTNPVGPLWVMSDDDGTVRQASRHKLFARASLALAVLPEDIRKQIKLRSLHSAFEQYMVASAGLNPELGALIAGRSLLGRDAQSFYINVSRSYLHEKFEQAFIKLHNNILAEAKVISGATGSLTPWIHSEPTPNLWLGGAAGSMGSQFCPQFTKVSGFFRSIQEAIISFETINPDLSDDLHCIYLWEVLRLSIGMRPQVEPQFEESSFFPSSSLSDHDDQSKITWLRIADKASKKYDEYRYAPVHPLVVKLLYEQIARNKYAGQATALSTFKDTGRVGGKVLRLTRNRQWARLIKHADVKAILESAGIDYPFSTNWSRHFARSQLLTRLPPWVLDAFLGHHSRGLDPLDALETFRFRQAAALFVKEMGDLLHRLGINIIPNQRGGK